MLRIDESSKTLVAPQQAAFVAEAAPAREELLALLAGGWQAFADEIGQSHLKFLAAAPVAGVDVLAFDEAAGRVAVVHVGDAFSEALAGAAEVAGMDAARLAEVHAELTAAVPGDSPKIVMIGGGWDERTMATLDWLVRRHGLEVTAYQVHTLRFGSERMMQVSRAYPSPEPAADPAAAAQNFFANVAGAAPAMPGNSAPPPGVPAA